MLCSSPHQTFILTLEGSVEGELAFVLPARVPSPIFRPWSFHLSIRFQLDQESRFLTSMNSRYLKFTFSGYPQIFSVSFGWFVRHFIGLQTSILLEFLVQLKAWLHSLGNELICNPPGISGRQVWLGIIYGTFYPVSTSTPSSGNLSLIVSILLTDLLNGSTCCHRFDCTCLHGLLMRQCLK